MADIGTKEAAIKHTTTEDVSTWTYRYKFVGKKIVRYQIRGNAGIKPTYIYEKIHGKWRITHLYNDALGVWLEYDMGLSPHMINPYLKANKRISKWAQIYAASSIEYS